MELELKHLAPYLPYGLKFEHVEYDYSDKVNHNITKMESLSADLITFEDCSDYYFDADNFDGYNPTVVPLLLPTSSLYTEMEDGKVPIVELFKMLCTEDDPYESFHIRLMSDCLEIRYNQALFYFEEGAFRYTINDKLDVFIPNQLDLLTYLFEHHFDVFGLIDKGLALDKTKIK